jgi:hypothetical protein
MSETPPFLIPLGDASTALSLEFFAGSSETEKASIHSKGRMFLAMKQVPLRRITRHRCETEHERKAGAQPKSTRAP